tara:strand:- start:187 stop:738 length:552 start_codon:yes stop_codon:yes gene_type:complete
LVVKINQSDLITKNLADIKLITKIEAVLYLKGRPISKKDLSEITNADINSIIKVIDKLKIKYSSPESAIQLNEINNSYCLELRSTLNDFVEDLLPSELKTSELRTLATIAIKKKILQSDLIVLRGSGAYDHIKELLNKNFILRRKQKDGRSYWITLSEKFFQTFAVSNEYLSQIGGNKKKMLD